MKLLICGCFHGKVNSKIFKIIKKEKPDAVLCAGDFSDGKELRKWEFKYSREIDEMLFQGYDWSKIVRMLGDQKECERLEKKDARKALKILQKLSKIKIPFYYIYGNHDGCAINHLKKFPKKHKNFHFIPKNILNISDYQIVSYGGYRGTTGKFHMFDKSKVPKKHIKLVKNLMKHHTKELTKLFSRKSATTIFITHDPPYKTKLDILKLSTDKRFLNKHIGDDVYRKIDEKFQPMLHLCAHMHENQGIDKIGKTTIINCGESGHGHFALLTLNEDKISNLKFY